MKRAIHPFLLRSTCDEATILLEEGGCGHPVNAFAPCGAFPVITPISDVAISFVGTADCFPRSNRSAARPCLATGTRFTQERRTLVRASSVRKNALVESEQRLPSCRPSQTLAREVVRFLPPDSSHTDARLFASLSLSHESFSERETLPSARPFGFSQIFRPGKNNGHDAYDRFLPTQTSTSCTRISCIPGTSPGLAPRWRKHALGHVSLPVTFTFHDAKIASVGDDIRTLHFPQCRVSNSPYLWRFCRFLRLLAGDLGHRSESKAAKIASCQSSVKKRGIHNPKRLPSIGAFSRYLQPPS